MKNVSVGTRRLRYFVAVAETLNFHRAAERLNISQPPLSQQIKALETDLGVLLFVRHRRAVELTEAGRTLFQRARPLLAAFEAVAVEVGMVGRGEMGLLGIGFMSAAMLGRLASILAAFRADRPKVEVRLSQAQPKDQIAAVAAGQIDVGFLSVALQLARGATRDKELLLEPVWKEEMVVALPHEHPLARRKRLSIQHLAHEDFLTLPQSPIPGQHEHLIALCHTAGGYRPRLRQEVEQLPVALALIAAGYGISLVPACATDDRCEGVTFRRLVERPDIAVAMIRRAGNPSSVVAAFHETATQRHVNLYRATGLR
jgi:DNA-binding transcriptional LysR family regulator